ncbi:MAG TPA: O-antigen ligase family protein [Solirubrobacteraceae bacterium]
MTFGGALLALALARASAEGSPAVILAPAVLALGALAMVRPLALLVAMCVTVVVLELNEPVFAQLANPLYTPVFKGLNSIDFVILLLLVATGLDAHRREAPLLGAGPLSWPLALLGAATLAGAATGYYRGASIKAVYEPVVILSHVVLLPFVVVNLVRDRSSLLARAIVLIAVLAVYKSLLGLYVVASSHEALVGSSAATYLEPTANWLVMMFLLGVLACALQRVRLPLWVWGAVPLALADFVLSYRRSFWVGAVLGIAVVVLVGSGRRGRRIVIPSVAVLGIAAAIFLSHLGSAEVASSPVLSRAASLNPTSLSANAEDRYRIDERRNVLANLSSQPITGLGIAIPWSATRPLSLEHPGGREYVHFTALWYWMKLGLLGLLAYLSLIVATIWTAARVWRRHPAALVRACALGMLGAALGLFVAELTATFTGGDYRFSIVYPVMLGLLASADLQARLAARATAPEMSARAPVLPWATATQASAPAADG